MPRQREMIRRSVQREVTKRRPGRPRKNPQVILVHQDGTSETIATTGESPSPTNPQLPFTDGGESSGVEFVDAEPEQEAPKKRPDVAPRQPRKSAKDAKILVFLQQIYGLGGLALYARNEYDGTLLASNSQNLAASVLAVSKHHPQFYQFLDMVSSNSDYVVLISLHGMVLFGIFANHGIAPVWLAKGLGAPEPPPREPRPPSTAPRRSFWPVGRTPVSPQPQPDMTNGAVPPDSAPPVETMGAPAPGAVNPAWQPVERVE